MSPDSDQSRSEGGDVLFVETLRVLQRAGGELLEDLDVAPALAESLRQLAERGLVEKTLVHNLFVCPECRSADLRLIERCVRCRSIDIDAQALIHHCACSAVFPANRVRRDSMATCTKCDVSMGDYPDEFEEAGFVYLCHHCGRSDAEPAVSLHCLSCGRESESHRLLKRRLYRYRLNPAGRAILDVGA